MASLAFPATSPSAVSRHRRAQRRMRALLQGVRVARDLAWPLLDVAQRLWLAQVFLVSGVLKLTHWDTALYLATYEYPVSWLTPHSAAVLGVTVEVVAPPALAAGFATRYAALALFALTAVTQFAYRALDTQLFWLALLGWYAVQGAGPVSLDRALRGGIASSALPLLPYLVRLGAALRARLMPAWLLLLRLWLALALLGSTALPASLLPTGTFTSLPQWVALGGALLLASGTAVRVAALTLAVAASATLVMEPNAPDHAYHVLSLLLLAMQGGGWLTVDAWITRWWAARTRASDAPPQAPCPRVVIVGGGFGGLACAFGLRDAPVDVTLIDRTNHHLFQPLLYQVATAALSPGDIAVPLRGLLRDVDNLRVVFGTVSGVDTVARQVVLGARRLDYDYLVLATGASHGYFGRDEWASHAPGLKRLEDATAIRSRVLSAFERAENSDEDAERAALLTFVIVGGGPTGVELAGALAELARHGMAREFRRIDPRTARIVLVQSAPRLLPQFSPPLSQEAARALRSLGVEVLTGTRVEAIDGAGVVANGERIAAHTVLWAAGVQASPAARWLGRGGDAAGRIEVGDDLSVPGLPNVYAIGDTAASKAWGGQLVPGLAPAAKQAGAYVATCVCAQVEGDPPPPPFRYRHRGSLATIGRQAAVVEFGRLRLWGAPAWWLWGAVHVGFLAGLRNRVATLVNWFWAYLSFGGGIRLITGSDDSRA